MRTGMPQVAFDFFKLDAQEILVDLKNGRNDNVYGEVLFHERVIEREGFFDKETVVVSSKR